MSLLSIMELIKKTIYRKITSAKKKMEYDIHYSNSFS